MRREPGVIRPRIPLWACELLSFRETFAPLPLSLPRASWRPDATYRCSTRVGVSTGFRDSLGNYISHDGAKSNFPVIAIMGSYIMGTETADCQFGFGGSYKCG